MKRAVCRDDDDGESDGSAESSSSLDEAKQLVKDYKAERSAEKKRRRGASADLGEDGGDGGGDENEPDEEGQLFIFDKRDGLDGSRKLLGVDGEEDLGDDVEEDLGTKIEPFHLREEMATGHFTEEGHYVERNFGAARDAWLDEMDEEDMGKKPVRGGT
jgi:hypothetical protein